MDRSLRTGLVAVGLVFCVMLTAMTIAAAFESGISVLTIAAGLILALLFPPLIGALFHPPDD